MSRRTLPPRTLSEECFQAEAKTNGYQPRALPWADLLRADGGQAGPTPRGSETLSPLSRLSIFMSGEKRIGIPRAAATRGNDRKSAHSPPLSFSLAWLQRV